MTEQETRGKIFNIIREFNVKKRRYSTHTEPSDDDELADALISAGIGDLKEHRIFAGKDGSIKQLYSGEEVEKIVKERKELKDELRSKVEYIHEQDEVIKEYKHRAEVAESELERYTGLIKPLEDENTRLKHRAGRAEKALEKFAENITCEDCPYFSDCASSEKMEDLIHSDYCFAEYLRQAEKELAEEEKDENI